MNVRMVSGLATIGSPPIVRRPARMPRRRGRAENPACRNPSARVLVVDLAHEQPAAPWSISWGQCAPARLWAD
jgi:hypothetical protein